MGIVPLFSTFKQTNSDVSAEGPDRRVRPTARDSEPFTLSLEEWIEVIIVGLKTMAVQGLLSFHHLENLEHRLWQHLQQQQQQ